ncbi:subtilisin-like protease Glyma18g48580 [Prosopis cineraria]|uniref:subtilisin-like protease Glyma18g48580 n=1 Tax=Prosopis cineraria TaxID=364024 RepID=UPI00240ECD96|nr:subtilisin-like protease Glyma18g48580 [Prosopis cineraria]
MVNHWQQQYNRTHSSQQEASLGSQKDVIICEIGFFIYSEKEEADSPSYSSSFTVYLNNVSASLSSFLLCSFFFIQLHQRAYAIEKSYVVYLGSHSHGPKPSSADMDSATNSHHDLLASVLRSHEKAKEAMFYSYNKHINGFAALLEDEEAEELKKNPKVVSVFLSQSHKLHTTRSWDFLGQEKNGRVRSDSAWVKGNFGDNVIIGAIDTGVWPESRSFRDNGYGPIPEKWRGGSKCELFSLSGPLNQTLCNRKIVGARTFFKGYETKHGSLSPSTQISARDTVGHGTHTLSTAGGNFVREVSVLRNGNGTAKGGSPRARLAVYKVCWGRDNSEECTDEDLLQAFDHAIDDGVDVLSISVGRSTVPNVNDMLTNGISIGSFHAISRGILVVASAGNDGPELQTVSNVAPWIFTIASGSIDREFSDNITLSNGQRMKGTSLATNSTSRQLIPVIIAGNARLSNATFDDADHCKPGTLDPNKVRGSILVCRRGRSLRPVDKGQEAKRAGALKMVLQNDKELNTATADAQVIDTSNFPTYHHQRKNKNTSQQQKNPFDVKNLTAFLDNAKTFIPIKPAPKVSAFSSRGPNLILPSILKPDVTAPGQDIIAAYSSAASPTNLDSDVGRFDYNILSGTSMACPHVAGIAGLLKTRYPKWSPAAIKSAIMTTATTQDNTNGPILDENDDEVATPYHYGSGHIKPNLAMDPGLVYDLTVSDYLNLLCASAYEERMVVSINYNRPYRCPRSYRLEDFNYPAITLPFLGVKPINATRTVTNVGPPGTYTANVKAPTGVKVVVLPKTLKFQRTNQKKSFQVILQATGSAKTSEPSFGELAWTDGKHKVRSPIVISQFQKVTM